MASVHWHLVVSVLLANFAGLFQFGYVLSIYNQPSRVIIDFINSTQHYSVDQSGMHGLWSVSMAMLNTGMLLGTLLGFFLCQRLGRKPSLLYSSSLGCMGAVLQSMTVPSQTYQLIGLGRFVSGVSVGVACVVVPLWGTEISPKQYRGAVGCVCSTSFAIGNLVANLVALPGVLGNARAWFYTPLFVLIFTLPVLMIFSWFPETPVYLMFRRANLRTVGDSLRFYQGRLTPIEYSRTLTELEKECIEGFSVPFREMIREKHYRKAVMITVALACANAFHGTAAIYAYMGYIIRWTGVTDTNSISTVSLLYPTIDVLFSFPTFFLIDKIGRRPLVLGSNWILTLCLFVLSFSLIIRQITSSHSIAYFYIIIVSLFIQIASISMGVAKANWFMNTELFPVQTRPIFTMVNSFTQNLLNMIMSASLLPLQESIGAYTFLVLFALPMLAFTIFLTFYIPETKRLTVTEILENLKGPNRWRNIRKRSDSATDALIYEENEAIALKQPNYGALDSDNVDFCRM